MAESSAGMVLAAASIFAIANFGARADAGPWFGTLGVPATVVLSVLAAFG
ncbi:MAG: hypothetical protein ABSA31_00675 [Acidimicrobiales bacterium]|jgi:hypothetical protein